MSSQVQLDNINIENGSLIAKITRSVATGMVLFLSSFAIAIVAVNVSYAGKVFPGVRMAGSDLSGLDAIAVESQISNNLDFQGEDRISLIFGEQTWDFSPAQLGYQIDIKQSVAAAMDIGREGGILRRLSEQLQSFRGGYDLEMRAEVDGLVVHSNLETIAKQINREAIEASLSIEQFTASGQDGQIGIELDTAQSALAIGAQLLLREGGSQELIVVESVPRILEVSDQVELANTILSRELQIFPGGNYADNPDAWTISRDQLGSMLSVERVEQAEGAYYQIGANSQELGAMLAAWAPLVYEESQTPRFIFNDDTRLLEVIEGEVIGRTLEIDASIEFINSELAKGSHSIELQYDYSPPAIRDNVSGAELGITELVNAETSYFYGSSSERIQNIQTASERFHGLLVAPGATFSMVENIGDISLESGFAEALIIYGDRTIKGVGGGVCQVSTTLFRNVFFAGFPVVERSPHAYRVYYYELNASGGIDPLAVGLDATVYSPIVDFKFVNDSEHWLLMETYVDVGGRSLTWKFYSTSDGREIEWDSSGVTAVIDAPDPIYEENDELDKGEVEQVDWAADGAIVTVNRTVVRDGEIVFEDEFKTKYSPWAAVYQYGPETPGYPPKQQKPVE